MLQQEPIRKAAVGAGLLLRLLVALSCLGLSACTGPHHRPMEVHAPLPDVPDSDYLEIEITAQNGWTLRIRPDGRAHYFYGSGGPFSSKPLPAGTLNFREVLARVRTFTSVLPRDVPQTQTLWLPGWYSVGLERSGSSQAEVCYTNDADFVRGLFEKAIAASRPYPEMAEFLRTHPPVPPLSTTKHQENGAGTE